MAGGARIDVTWLRDLTLEDGFVSAASGLVRLASRLFVVADDAKDLIEFDLNDPGPGRSRKLVAGTLPVDPGNRKKAKPDFEALTLLPPGSGFANSALLALGSGSKKPRRRGVVVEFDSAGELSEARQVLDLSPIYARLEEMVPDLNIEGAVVAGARIHLFHRGNRSNPSSTMFTIDLQDFLTACASGTATDVPIDATTLTLGETRGVPFTVTDAAALPDGRMVATMVAEDTTNAYDDGECVGGGVTLLSAKGAVEHIWHFTKPLKVEGVSAALTPTGIELLLVTDADNPAIAAVLFEARLELVP